MKIQTDVSKTDILHWFFNDIVLCGLISIITMSIIWWFDHNQYLRVQHQCPGIAQKFNTRYQITAQGCDIQTSTGSWVGIRID